MGRARDLRARLRSYFRSERQRPSVEAALLALERIEWRVLGSELEAALEELRLIRELQPPANSRSRRREHGVYLRRRGDDFVVTKKATELGPIPSRRRAALAARALAAATAGRARTSPRGRPAAASPSAARAARRRLPLRGSGTATRPDRRARAGRRAACAGSRSCTHSTLPDRPCARARLAEGVLRLRRRICAVRSLPPGAGARLQIDGALALCQAARRSGTSPLTPEAGRRPPAARRIRAPSAARARRAPTPGGSGVAYLDSLVGSGRASRRGRPGRARAPGVAARRGRRSAPSRPRPRARHWPASRRACGGAPRPDRRPARLAVAAGRRRRTYATSAASPASTNSRRHMRPMLQCPAELLATPCADPPGNGTEGRGRLRPREGVDRSVERLRDPADDRP